MLLSPPRWILGALIALLLSGTVLLLPFEDASGESDFGSGLYLNAPWAGVAYGNIRLIDIDADAVDEILVGGPLVTCSSTVNQLAVFHRDAATNKYAPLNYGQDQVFLGINFYAYIFERLGRDGSALPDIVACGPAFPYELKVLENHGGLNFSMSAVAFSTAAFCDFYFSVIAVADTDRDGRDEVFSSSRYSTDFFTRLPNSTLVDASSHFPALPLLQNPTGTFADLDGDLYMDLVWTDSEAYIFRNVGGNFSSVANSINGVASGSIAVAEFTGDGRADIVLSGLLANYSVALSLYENNGSMSFFRRPDAGFSITTYVRYSVAAVPMSSQSGALDLVVVPSAISAISAEVSVYINDGFGVFTPKVASWLPTLFKGAVARGPDIGMSPSFLAMGKTTSSSYEGSTLAGYLESGTLISSANIMFGYENMAFALRSGVVAVADYNYDGCIDALLSGYAAADSTIRSALLLGDCSGSLRIQSVGLPAIYDGVGVVRDFDRDGRLDYFSSGIVDELSLETETSYYRFNVDGIPENITSYLPALLGLRLSAVCVGAASGSVFDDIYVTGYNSVNLQYFLRNARNGSFNQATADLIGMNPVGSGSCAFATGAGGANSSLWMDIYSVGQGSTYYFNYMKNNRNGTFTNMVDSLAAFPGGAPTPCLYSSMVAADLNGDGREDLFYNGYYITWISRFYLREANDSMVRSTGLDATANRTRLRSSSSVAVDIDSDGDIDLVVAGEDSAFAKIMAALLNDGSGNFTDGTALVFGSLPGMSNGALAVAQLTNDSMPDLVRIGKGPFCGPQVLLQRVKANFSSSTTSTTTMSSSALPPSASGSSSFGGGLGSDLGFLLLL